MGPLIDSKAIDDFNQALVQVKKEGGEILYGGNTVKGETQLNTLMLSGKVRNAGEVRDLYVHQNDKKVFYKANLNHLDGYGDTLDNYQTFPFKTVINLSPGINHISVFSRGRHGFTSEHKLRILKRR